MPLRPSEPRATPCLCVAGRAQSQESTGEGLAAVGPGTGNPERGRAWGEGPRGKQRGGDPEKSLTGEGSDTQEGRRWEKGLQRWGSEERGCAGQAL